MESGITAYSLDLGVVDVIFARILWGEKGFLHKRYDVLAIWRERAVDVRGKAVPCGHFLPEEAPEETLAELRTFLRA